jgi:hypothetical protein
MRDFHYGKTPNRGRKRFRRRFEPLSASAGRRTENPAFFRFSPSARRTWRASMRTIHAYTSRRSSRRGERRCSFGVKLAAATALRDSSANGDRFRARAVTHRELCRRCGAPPCITRQNLTTIHTSASPTASTRSNRTTRRNSQEGELCREKRVFATKLVAERQLMSPKM